MSDEREYEVVVGDLRAIVSIEGEHRTYPATMWDCGSPDEGPECEIVSAWRFDEDGDEHEHETTRLTDDEERALFDAALAMDEIERARKDGDDGNDDR